MADFAPDMAAVIGPGCHLIEYGAGSSTKIRSLLDHLQDPAAFVAIDISGEHLVRAADDLKARYPSIEINPVVADFTARFDIPSPTIKPTRKVVYFPGSTIGNFTPEAASDLLKGMAELVGPGGGLLIGVDLDKEPDVLRAAYNDRKGVTGAFNLNLLVRLNREAGADFNLSCFSHRAVYNPEKSRIEMRLFSDRDQTAEIADHRFEFKAGESILTEYSHKYTVESFGKIAGEAGFRLRQVWMDADELFSVQYMELD
jgi:dimethylhistidine N-methyltransferase